MAKNKVTRESLRVGQSVWQVYWCVISSKFDYCLMDIENDESKLLVKYWESKTLTQLYKLKLQKTTTCFFSKKKAKRKMMILNEELKDG
jgi:hypothetical protein